MKTIICGQTLRIAGSDITMDAALHRLKDEFVQMVGGHGFGLPLLFDPFE
jgi:hypothetical protein